MLDIFLELIFVPSVWIGTVVGVLAAWAAWTYLPETADRVSIAAVLVIVGWIGGFLFAGVNRKRNDDG